jgi:hypothetical protein
MQEYLVKCIWHSTSFTIKVWATDEAHALKRAAKNPQARSAISYKVIGSR